LVSDAPVDRPWNHVPKQVTRITVRKPAKPQLLKVCELIANRAHCQQDRYALGIESASDKGNCLRGCVIKPLRVIYDAQQWSVACSFGKESQNCQPNQKPVAG